MRIARFVFSAILACAAGRAAPFDLKSGDRVVFLGDSLMEAEQYHGWIEVMLTTRFADCDVTFRNLGWTGDTPAGDSRCGLSLLQAGQESSDEGWRQLQQQLADVKPTVVFVGWGMASSFDGAAGLAKFQADYRRALAAIAEQSPGARFVLLPPLRHESLGAPWPDPAPHNAQLERYAGAIREIAGDRGASYVPLFEQFRAQGATDNGIHLNARGYRLLAEMIEEQLFGNSGAWRSSPQAEPLRQAILRKNERFFHRSRPANMAYIFGFRKHEQGRNAAEIPRFDAAIADAEKRIAQLRALRPVTLPEIPAAARTAPEPPAQPHPSFEIASGLEVTLWAENPLLHKPVQMNFDPRGRLWVASSETYPQIEPGHEAIDKIIVLEDTADRGRADKATVFAEGLLIPTGIAPGDGGCYVAQSTQLLHFRDTDGDDKADVRRVVLSGFGAEDTHHNLHTLRWGPDGRLYMNQSVYIRTGTETPHGVVRLKGSGIFRFDPRDQRMEIVSRGWVNPWGHQFDEYGQSFISDGAGSRGLSRAVPGATYFTLAPARRVMPGISPGVYPKFCGLEIIRSGHFPANWQGDAITCDFRAHRVVRFKLADRGSGFVTREMPDVLRTTDVTFRPIDARLGPDGALYIADWSNPIIQHGEVDFRDPRRDRTHGRIWRIAMKGDAALPTTDFTRPTNHELLDRLHSRSNHDQEQARRVLVERGAEKVLPDLTAWTAQNTDAKSQLQALWMHEAFDASFPEVLASTLVAKDARIRAAAVRVLADDPNLTSLAKLVADESPRVRLEAVRALAGHKTARAAELALTVLGRPMDPFLDYALWLTINQLAEPWVAAVKSGAWDFKGHENQLEFALKAIAPEQAGAVLSQLVHGKSFPVDGSGPWIELIGTAGGARELRQVFDQLLGGSFNDAGALRVLTALREAARLRNAKPNGNLAALDRMLDATDERIRIAALQLAGTWKFSGITTRLLQCARSADASAAEHAAAFAALREIGGVRLAADLKALIAETTSAEIRNEAVVALAAIDLDGAIPDVVTALKTTSGEAHAVALWRGLLGIRGASAKLATALASAPLPPAVARAGLRPAREGNQHHALAEVLMKQAGLALSDAQLSAAELAALAREALVQGDPARGERIYRRPDLACMACHAIGGAGGKVGPDLTSIGASAPPDYLVESLLYPATKIKEGYHSVSITTKNRQEISGMIVREDDHEIVLRDAANREVSLSRKEIARRTSIGSLMPPGLIDTLLPDERSDLIKFLSMLGQPGDYDAAKGGVARAWSLYLVINKNQHLGIDRVVQGDVTLADWTPAVSLVNGTLPKEAFEAAFPTRAGARGLFAATRFESAKAGLVKFQLVGATRGIWLNGTPVTGGAERVANARSGANTLVVQLSDALAPTPLKLTSADASFVTP